MRRPKLRLSPERSKHWLQGRARTLIAHALSPTFPGGERFFIKSVMAFKHRIDDPRLLEEMRRFAAQEASHSRYHETYDAAVQEHYDLQRIEALTERDLNAVFEAFRTIKRPWFNGPRASLAMTVALEHVTAILARQILSDNRILEGADPDYARLWQWHAAEEIEHKAVAFDVFEAVGGTWLERTLALGIMGNLLLFGSLFAVAMFLRRDGQAASPQAWADIADFLLVSPGILRKIAPDVVDFLRPGFHPWDADDRPLLAKWAAGAARGQRPGSA